MVSLSNQHIKEFLTTIAKNILILILLTNLSCNKMNEQKIKVIGDESLLKDCKINVSTSTEANKKTTESLLYKGKIKEISIDNETGEFYKIYVSYNDSLATSIEFENILRNMNNPPDVILIIEKNDKGFIGVKKTHSKEFSILLTIENYFKLNKIDNEETKNKEKKLFFDSY